MSVYRDRLESLRQNFDTWGIDALYVTCPTHRRWLSGFTGSAGQLLVTPARAWLATDFRYWEQVSRQAPDFELYKHKRQIEDVHELLNLAGVQRIGLESAHISLKQARELERLNGFEWISLDDTLETPREIKTPDEVERISAAAAITDQAMAQVSDLAQLGMTELQLAWLLEKTMRELGAHGMAFPPIVASGPNSALPHHAAGERRLQSGDALVIDMGAAVDGYRSDLTRSFFLGPQLEEQFETIYSVVLRAQQAALAALRPGLGSHDAHEIANSIIADAGYGEYFAHGLGHGLGLDIHEGPRLSSLRKNEPLPEGAVVTVEPGIYIPGWGGVRIEDLVHLTEGGAHLLSHCPKSPLIRL